MTKILFSTRKKHIIQLNKYYEYIIVSIIEYKFVINL